MCEATPIIEIHKVDVDPGGWIFAFRYRVIWPNERNNTIICHNATAECSVTTCAVRKAATSSPTCRVIPEQGAVISIPPQATANDATDIWRSRYGEISTKKSLYSGTSIANQYKDMCLVMTVMDSTIERPKNGNFFPGSSCAYVPPPNLSCTVSDTLNINYGSLADSLVNGAKSSGDVILRCSAPATITLQLLGPKKIDLGRSGKLLASRYINDSNLANKFSVRVDTNNTSLRITSELESLMQYPDPGNFTGIGVLMMTYQ